MWTVTSAQKDIARWTKYLTKMAGMLAAVLLAFGIPQATLAYGTDPQVGQASNAASAQAGQTTLHEQAGASAAQAPFESSHATTNIATPAVDGAVVQLIAVTAASLTALIFALLAWNNFNAIFKKKDHTFTFRRHWGGFGGTVTGWHISSATIQLLVGGALALASLLLALAILQAVFSASGSEARVRPVSNASASESARASTSTK